MSKSRLMTPGPTQVPEAARLAMAQAVIHHRSPEFRAIFSLVLDGLKYVFQTDHDVVVLTASGTGAMEAAVVNLVPRGGKAIVIEAGVFARRWAHIARAFGIQVVLHEVPWGEAVDPADVGRLLAQHPDAVAVFGTLLESSTGVAHDVKSIAAITRQSQALLVVDAISGAGAIECRMDDWGIDVLVVGSQKALMMPPGLAFLAIGPRAWAQIERIEPQAFYFNLKLHRAKLAVPETPWTPAITLVLGLAEALRQIRQTGIENIWRRTDTLARATRAGVQALGLELFAQRPAAGLTAVRMPSNTRVANALLTHLEHRFSIKLAGGQDRLKGQIFRIGHFGLIDSIDVLGTLAALELTLAELGQAVEPGAGVAAARPELLAEFKRPVACIPS